VGGIESARRVKLNIKEELYCPKEKQKRNGNEAPKEEEK